MKRYDPYVKDQWGDVWADMEEGPIGDWVKYEDMQKLVEALAKIKHGVRHDTECCSVNGTSPYLCDCQRGNILTIITDALKFARGDDQEPQTEGGK